MSRMVLAKTRRHQDLDALAQKIVGVKMSIDIGGNKISYDSRKPGAKNPMTSGRRRVKHMSDNAG